jgi:hypothetical protein
MFIIRSVDYHFGSSASPMNDIFFLIKIRKVGVVGLRAQLNVRACLLMHIPESLPPFSQSIGDVGLNL